MNNEPVAYVDNVWINRPDLAMDLGIGQMFSRCQLSDHQIPLYTHPAKESKAKDRFSNYESICLQCGTTIYKPAFKTLTDDEILKLYLDCWDEIEFARAILRKAQEK